MSGNRKSAEDRKREVVDTALRLLSVLSVETLTTERIANEVGISQAAIFRHFPTKHALWLAILETVESRAITIWDTALSSTDAPLDRLRHVLEAQLSLIAATPAIPKLVFTVGQLSTETDLREVHMRIMARLRGILLHEAETAAANGSLRASIPAMDITALFLGLVQGTVLRWQLSDRSFDLCHEGARLIDCQIRLLTHQGPDTL